MRKTTPCSLRAMLKMLGLGKAFLGCTRPSKDQFTDSRGFQRRQVFQTGCLFEASLPLNKQPPKPDFSRQPSQSPHVQATHEEWDPKVCPTHVTQTVGRAKSIHLPTQTHTHTLTIQNFSRVTDFGKGAGFYATLRLL